MTENIKWQKQKFVICGALVRRTDAQVGRWEANEAWEEAAQVAQSLAPLSVSLRELRTDLPWDMPHPVHPAGVERPVNNLQ